MSPNSPKTDEALQLAYRKLVEEVMVYFTEPMNWPLTNSERIRMIRWIYSLAKEIAESEPFLRAKLEHSLQASLRQQVLADVAALKEEKSAAKEDPPMQGYALKVSWDKSKPRRKKK